MERRYGLWVICGGVGLICLGVSTLGLGIPAIITGGFLTVAGIALLFGI